MFFWDTMYFLHTLYASRTRRYKSEFNTAAQPHCLDTVSVCWLLVLLESWWLSSTVAKVNMDSKGYYVEPWNG